MPLEPIDLLFARATAAHIDRLIVAGRDVVRDGRLATVDLDATEAALRQDYRDRIGSRAAFLDAWRDLEPAAVAHYLGGFGCC